MTVPGDQVFNTGIEHVFLKVGRTDALVMGRLSQATPFVTPAGVNPTLVFQNTDGGDEDGVEVAPADVESRTL